MSPRRPVPGDVFVDRQAKQLTITWDDGVKSVISLTTLRRNCPCAVCRSLRQSAESSALTVLSPQQISATDELAGADFVGRYALQIRWKDGHDTGIYSFDYLRELDPQLAASKVS